MGVEPKALESSHSRTPYADFTHSSGQKGSQSFQSSPLPASPGPLQARLDSKPDPMVPRPVDTAQLLAVSRSVLDGNPKRCTSIRTHEKVLNPFVLPTCSLPPSEQKYPIVWQGLLALKNDTAAVQLHFVSGNNVLAHRSLPPPEGAPLLRIAQRMRLEASQLEGVARRMTVSTSCLAFTCHCQCSEVTCTKLIPFTSLLNLIFSNF